MTNVSVYVPYVSTVSLPPYFIYTLLLNRWCPTTIFLLPRDSCVCVCVGTPADYYLPYPSEAREPAIRCIYIHTYYPIVYGGCKYGGGGGTGRRRSGVLQGRTARMYRNAGPTGGRTVSEWRTRRRRMVLRREPGGPCVQTSRLFLPAFSVLLITAVNRLTSEIIVVS